MSESRLGLAEVIDGLRAELLKAVEAGDGSPLRFALGTIELEVQLEIEHQAGADAGVRFWVISTGGSASRTSSSSQTVRLTLAPVATEGEDDVLVASSLPHRPR
jgi:hypothetical protein